MKKKTIYIAVIIIAITSLIYFLLSQKWLNLERKTYENSRYNFSLEYSQKWSLGEPDTNNAGRELLSPDEKALCYAYGFANALINEQGQPQTLEEFIDWLTEDLLDIKQEVLQKENSTLASRPAIKLFIKENEGYKQAIYTLGKETGIGFICVYPDLETAQNYSEEFNNIVRSFDIKLNLDGEDARIEAHD